MQDSKYMRSDTAKHPWTDLPAGEQAGLTRRIRCDATGGVEIYMAAASVKPAERLRLRHFPKAELARICELAAQPRPAATITAPSCPACVIEGAARNDREIRPWPKIS
jgi:hypothetical protein